VVERGKREKERGSREKRVEERGIERERETSKERDRETKGAEAPIAHLCPVRHR
jgi:hypothetical protein